MIHYNLRCAKGHAFESWFQSSSAYEVQEKRKLINCPVCGSTRVERAIMAPQIVRKKGRGATASESLPVPASNIEIQAVAAIPSSGGQAIAVGFTHSSSGGGLGSDVVGAILQYGG